VLEHAIYDDFSMPTFDDNHNIIKGGSWISLGNESTKFSRYSSLSSPFLCLTARYAFRRHFYQHAGIRVAYTPSDGKVQAEAEYTDYDQMNKNERGVFDAVQVS
jgi:hypothetical protein